jgi:hypothetical protein
MSTYIKRPVTTTKDMWPGVCTGFCYVHVVEKTSNYTYHIFRGPRLLKLALFSCLSFFAALVPKFNLLSL